MSNSALVLLLAGVLIGWVTYFLVDLFFLRRPKSDSRITTLEADLQRYDDDLRAVAARRDSLQADLDGAVSARNQAQADLRACQRNLADCKSRTDQLAVDLQGRDQKLAELQAQLDVLRVERDRLNTSSDQVKGDLRVCGEELSNARTRIAALQTELDALKASHDQQTGALRAELTAPPSPAEAPTKSTVLPLSFSAPPEVEAYATECPQHLSDVKGIGTVFEQKLYEAGIGTFWVLANLENDQLKKLLDIQDFQNVNLDELRADALRLAQETNSIGRVWNRMQPDDFEAIGGIGYTYEKRLYDAGVCTYRALAQASVEQLREICKPPAFRVPDFAAWIAAAKKLLEKE